jgi:phospholipid/cholesterol/gamma-HCH transport system permease protein
MHRTEGGALLIAVSGDWLVQRSTAGIEAVENELTRGDIPRRLEFDTSDLGKWDSALVAFAINCFELCQRLHVQFADWTLPPGVRKLIRLAQAVPEKREAKRQVDQFPWLHRVGERVLAGWSAAHAATSFLGEVVLGSFNLLRGRAQFRWPDAFVVMQECGPEALGVVALINFLVGLILAFVGAVQLSQFGATIYVADLVAVATVREMGCLMTGIILCGRTGAAFAAQLGTMKVNEEIDAFRTLGISPLEFLVLPRVIALVLMMPLLCVFADFIAITGGYVVSISMLDVGSIEYIDRTIQAITLRSFMLGIVKSACFGALVAMTGCLRGLSSGDSAAAVGLATTSAVVTGITSIIAADGIFAVICYALGI